MPLDGEPHALHHNTIIEIRLITRSLDTCRFSTDCHTYLTGLVDRHAENGV